MKVMPVKLNPCPNTDAEKAKHHILRVAILAEEPLGWGSGKHFFPVILQNYTWVTHNKTYEITVKYLYDKDIENGRLNTTEFDVLLVPGGGVGDGHAVVKGFIFLRRVKRWKKNISFFIKNGGGYVGICGGAALLTDLKTENKKSHTLLERQYNKSSLNLSCVSSYYKTIAFALFYPFQKNHPENIGALAYVFSFAPGETVDGVRIHSGGIPLDFNISQNHPIFSDCKQTVQRIRWWGGPALITPKNPDRKVQVLATYPKEEISDNTDLRIHAWRYIGGVRGLLLGVLKAARYIKKENESLKNLFLYTYYMAGDWEITDKVIKLDFANKPSITAEIYPNNNKGRILLCTAHPEYMVWWNGHITEKKKKKDTCLGTGLHQWEMIAQISKDTIPELTHTWWMIRRFIAWAAKVPDDELPPIQKEESIQGKSSLLKNVLWDGSLRNQMENI